MPRPPRFELRGFVHHVINRGNARATVFHKDADYRAFLSSLHEAKTRVPVRIYAFCILSNHFHLVIQPRATDTLSRFMHWWLTTHARRYHAHYAGSGHIWQGRFKSFPIQGNDHLLTVIRYVLQNPVRAGVVAHAREYPWSSTAHPKLTDHWPVPPPKELSDWLSQPIAEGDLSRLRACVNRQTPFAGPMRLMPPTPRRPKGRPPTKRGTGPRSTR